MTKEEYTLSKVKVHAGICGFISNIKVNKTEGKNAKVKIVSACGMIKDLSNEMTEINWIKSITREMADSEVYKITDKYITHAACPVPSAILKAVEVEFGLALPKDVTMKIEKD